MIYGILPRQALDVKIKLPDITICHKFSPIFSLYIYILCDFLISLSNPSYKLNLYKEEIKRYGQRRPCIYASSPKYACHGKQRRRVVREETERQYRRGHSLITKGIWAYGGRVDLAEGPFGCYLSYPAIVQGYQGSQLTASLLHPVLQYCLYL